jgi:hypothetical protein
VLGKGLSVKAPGVKTGWEQAWEELAGGVPRGRSPRSGLASLVAKRLGGSPVLPEAWATYPGRSLGVSIPASAG